MSTLTNSDLEALVSQFQVSDARELHVRTDQFEIFLSKDPHAPAPWGAGGKAASSLSSEPASPSKTSRSTAQSEQEAEESSTAEAPEELPEGCDIVRAPYLGTFYRAPKPGQPNYVEPGDRVQPGKDLCLVEVMKLFTAVRSEVTGTIRDIYAEDGQTVAEGQPLFAIEPED